MNTRVPPFDRRRFLLGAGALATTASLPRVLFARTGGQAVGRAGDGIAGRAGTLGQSGGEAQGRAPGQPESRAAQADDSARLVVVILRGALDGLAAVPPYGDAHYAGLRQELAIGAPGSDGGALDLDGRFGLHPSLDFLHERYQAGELAVLHAIASPYRDRSHFDGQAVLENGLTHTLGSSDGWLNRTLAAMPVSAVRPVERALSVGQNLPLILRGDQQVLSKAPQAAPEADEDLLMRLADLYSKDSWFAMRLQEAVESEKLGGPVFTGSRLQKSAALAGSLLAASGGPDIAAIEATGWDTHANQGGATGILARRLGELDEALKTLAANLGERWSSTVTVIVTEFGRTAAMNGTRGTDHGTGSCCLVLGGAVAGGRVIADWPGLGAGDLYQGRDLKPTLDLRSVFKSVLGEHLGIERAALEKQVFPESAHARALSGLIRV